MNGRAAKDMAMKMAGGAKYVLNKTADMVKSMVKNRMEAQKNFQNRKDDSNYNRSASYWAKNKN